jgi:hypothetical protein
MPGDELLRDGFPLVARTGSLSGGLSEPLAVLDSDQQPPRSDERRDNETREDDDEEFVHAPPG